jgi:DNA-binding transcriptional LysR family regulator
VQLPWDDLRLFLAAWEAGTLSAAAEELGLAQATVSRRVALLEEHLGHVLFERSRRGLTPTPAARALHPHALVMAAAAREAAAAVQGLTEAPRGEVRLAVPPGIAVHLLPALLPPLRTHAPEVRLCILAHNRMLDLERHEADLALRSWPPTTGELVSRMLPAVAMGVFAAPELAERLAPCRTDPQALPWVQWSDDLAHIPQARLIRGWLGERSPAFRSNSFLVLQAAAVQGLGCMLMPRFQGQQAGLVELPVALPPTLAAGAPVYLVMPRALRRLPRVRVVADLLVELVERVVGGADPQAARPSSQ